MNMRDFAELLREYSLIPLTESHAGDLYVPASPDGPDLVVRHFARGLAPEMIPAFVELHRAAQHWIETDELLTSLARVEQPAEQGRDCVARRFCRGTSLRTFMSTDPDDDRPESPDELAVLQERFQARASAVSTDQERVVAEVLSRSLLTPTAKTVYRPNEARFVVVELKVTRDDLERWLAGSRH